MYEMFDKLLQMNGVSAYKVAKETGISSATLSDWKLGRSTPKLDKLQKIADYFNVGVDYLMNNDVEKEENNYYYLNDETRKIAQEAFENKDMRMLFDVARGIKPEKLKAHIDFMKALRDNEENND